MSDAGSRGAARVRDVLADLRRRHRALRSRRWFRRAGTVLGMLVVVLAGATVGTALTPSVDAQVGPLRLAVRVVPSLDPGVHLLVPPAGRVTFSTHLAPVAVEARISEVDLEKARALIETPGELDALQTRAPDALRRATIEAALLFAGSALAGAVVLSLLVHRVRWRRTGQVAATVSGVLVLTAGTTALTFDSDSFAQPRFDGLLSQAPYVANQTSSLVKRLESYRSGLADIVQNVTTLYAEGGDLPVIPGVANSDVTTVLHISDIHLNPLGFDLAQRLVDQFRVDVVVDTGDITTWGTEVESTTLSRIGDLKVPYVFVRGNHDSRATQRAVAANPNAVVLDGEVKQVAGLVFAGLGDPRFTPDGAVTLGGPLSAPPGERTLLSPGTPSPTGPPASPGVGSPTSSGAATSTGPQPSTAAQAVVPGEDPELIEGRRLAAIIRDWNDVHPDRPVDVAAFHEPAGTPPLDGLVPLALVGHMHTRSVKVYDSGTRVMTEGSTGGAGFDALKAADEGRPVPLTATVLYFARSGERAGELVAYDEVTVGGFGLASVSLDRTVLRPDAENQLAPGEVRGPAACPVRPSPTADGPTPPDAAGTSAGPTGKDCPSGES